MGASSSGKLIHKPRESRYNERMFPVANILFRPLAHGAVGIWDEVLNVVPLVFGAGLLIYLYRGARKRRAAEAHQAEAGAEPPAEPQEASER